MAALAEATTMRRENARTTDDFIFGIFFDFHSAVPYKTPSDLTLNMSYCDIRARIRAVNGLHIRI